MVMAKGRCAQENDVRFPLLPIHKSLLPQQSGCSSSLPPLEHSALALCFFRTFSSSCILVHQHCQSLHGIMLGFSRLSCLALWSPPWPGSNVSQICCGIHSQLLFNFPMPPACHCSQLISAMPLPVYWSPAAALCLSQTKMHSLQPC